MKLKRVAWTVVSIANDNMLCRHCGNRDHGWCYKNASFFDGAFDKWWKL